MNALRAFEAAARLGGFAAAAEELGVTPGAISQHLRGLEAWAGAPLFERRSQGVRLTAAGEALLPEFTAAFDAVGRAVRSLRAAGGTRALHLAVLPSVAQLWLAPRLPGLRAALPGVRISVSALETPPNLDREMFDLSLFIRRPTGAPGDIVLARDAILPVCAPSLAAAVTTPPDLVRQVLLHDASWADDWACWAQATGCDLRAAGTGPQFSLYALALAEAASGAGVLMAHEVLTQSALAAGDLVAPLGRAGAVPTGKALVLTHPAHGTMPAPLRALVALLQEAA